MINDANKFSIAEYFEFDERQGDYYGNAAVYIGLVQKRNSLYLLTDLGREIVQITNRRNRNLMLIKAIVRTRLFNDLMKLYFQQNENIDDNQILFRIAREGLTGTTPNRRKSTIKAWLQWIVSNLSQ